MFAVKAHSIRTALIAAAGAAGLVVTVGVGADSANAGTLPPCDAAQLSVTTIYQQAAMGHRQVTYEITSTSEQACVVHGAPSSVTQSDGAHTVTVVGDTYFTANGPSQMIRLDPGESAVGEIAWGASDIPVEGSVYSLSVDLPDIGTLDTGYLDNTGARGGVYTVTNLVPAP